MLIGIAGRKFHGKDTIADYFINEHKYKKIAYADKLKTVCSILFGFTHEQLYGDKKEINDEIWNITPRRAMQFLGTELIRKQMHKLIPDIGEEFWIKCLINHIKQHPETKFVVCDVRFPNEAQAIKDNGGIIIKVFRPGIPEDEHESESLFESIKEDYLVINDSDKESLYSKIKDIIESLT